MASSDQSSSAEIVETEFKHFDVVPEIPSDHHFLSSNGKSSKHFTSDGNPSLDKKIMREWRILGKNLPESIYVRVFETRIDLLRAVIVGSPNTPYHNGLFFFDIVLPHLYPNDPPKVYYRSHGYRLNPNLYECGKVCLSLLNTWYGNNKEEEWSKESTILQVLVSIQGLVLNERPYFNEPAYANLKNSLSMETINASLGYNYTALILSCETMMQIKRNPPVCFEAFVDQHFKDRAGSILAFVEEYRDGCALGGQFPLNNSNMSIDARSFKTRLDQIHLKLKKEFGCNIESETNNAVGVGGRTDSVSMDIEQVANGSSSDAQVVAIPAEYNANGQAFAFCIFILLVLIFVVFIIVIEVVGGKRSS